MSHGLGQLILDRRRELGLSQQELARRIGIPTANLSSLEHTVTRWQSRLVVALADELKLPQIELAMAAGIITDLPPLGDDEDRDVFDAALLGFELGDARPESVPPAELPAAIAQLTPSQQAFVGALVGQLLARVGVGSR